MGQYHVHFKWMVLFLVPIEILKISIIYKALDIVKIMKVSTAKTIKIRKVKGNEEIGDTVKPFEWEKEWEIIIMSYKITIQKSMIILKCS